LTYARSRVWSNISYGTIWTWSAVAGEEDRRVGKPRSRKLAVDVAPPQDSHKFRQITLYEQADSIVADSNAKGSGRSLHLLDIRYLAPVRGGLHLQDCLPDACQDSLAPNPLYVALEAGTEGRFQGFGSRSSITGSRLTSSVCRPSSIR
jgi:hypothetical protein